MITQSIIVASSISLITSQLSTSDAVVHFNHACIFIDWSNLWNQQSACHTRRIVTQQKPAKQELIPNTALLVTEQSTFMTPLSGAST